MLRRAERVFIPLRTCSARIACGVDGAYLVVVVGGLDFVVDFAGVVELLSSVGGGLRVDMMVWVFSDARANSDSSERRNIMLYSNGSALTSL